jgi:hypothetical protein
MFESRSWHDVVVYLQIVDEHLDAGAPSAKDDLTSIARSIQAFAGEMAEPMPSSVAAFIARHGGEAPDTGSS